MGEIITTDGGGIIGLIHGSSGVTLPKPFEHYIYLFDTYVAGTSHIEGIDELEPFLNIDDKLEFFREPDNAYDPKAIVIKTTDGVKVGYVPEKDNVIFARLMDAGKLLFGRITSKKFEGKWLRMNIKIFLQEDDCINLSYSEKTMDIRKPDSNNNEWCYVKTKEDAEYLMYETCGFHDSILKSADYVSGGYVDENKSMHISNDLRRLRLVLDSQMTDNIELIFESVILFHLLPTNEGYMADISCASVFVNKGIVSFVDYGYDKEEFDPEHDTYVKAKSLRWRFIK